MHWKKDSVNQKSKQALHRLNCELAWWKDACIYYQFFKLFITSPSFYNSTWPCLNHILVSWTFDVFSNLFAPECASEIAANSLTKASWKIPDLLHPVREPSASFFPHNFKGQPKHSHIPSLSCSDFLHPHPFHLFSFSHRELKKGGGGACFTTGGHHNPWRDLPSGFFPKSTSTHTSAQV